MARYKYNYDRQYTYIPHIDNDWISRKINGHGGGYYTKGGPKGLAILTYIGDKKFYHIWYYNVILFVRYIKRLVNYKHS